MADLPPYAVRVSDRARRVRLVVSARDGLVVVVPRRFPQRSVLPIVEERRAWIERALERVREQREVQEASRGLPERLELPGIGAAFDVAYVATAARGVRATFHGTTLRLSGDIADEDACRAALRRFCRSRALAALPPLLSELSAEQGLRFDSVAVRDAKTRWGSCSSRGRIALSWRLAFLPPQLVRHVMLHELVHTMQLDHSPRFHALLAEREPASARLAAELRSSWRHVPGWSADG